MFKSKAVTLLFDWMAPEACGLGVVEGRGAPFSLLRPVCGVAGAEVALDDMGAVEGLREARGSCSEEEGGEAASHGEQMEGSEMLLVKAGCWSWPAVPRNEACEELWSELEDRLSVLRAGEGEQEEGRD